MVSTASHVGRLKHRQELEREKIEQALAGDEEAFRADKGRQLKAEDDRTYGRRSTELSADDVRARDERHQRVMVDAMQRFYPKQEAKRSALRDRHRAELEKARNTKPTPGKHVPLPQPEPHHPVFEIWKDLNSARREAVLGVYRSTALLRDNADAEVVNFAKTRAASRYEKPGSGLADKAGEALEDKHAEISRDEHKKLLHLLASFEADMRAERRRYEEHAAERHAMTQRHAAENRRTA